MSSPTAVRKDSGDSGGGTRSTDVQNYQQTLMAESQREDEPICFDQTTRHIGSIQKNMVFLEREDSLNPQFNPGMKGNMRPGNARMDESAPNYS